MGACSTQKILGKRSKTLSFLICLIGLSLLIYFKFQVQIWLRNGIGLSPSLLLELSNVNKLFAEVSLRWGVLDDSPLEQGLCLPSHPQHWSLTADIYFKLCSFPVKRLTWLHVTHCVLREVENIDNCLSLSSSSLVQKVLIGSALGAATLLSSASVHVYLHYKNNLVLRTYGWHILENKMEDQESPHNPIQMNMFKIKYLMLKSFAFFNYTWVE